MWEGLARLAEMPDWLAVFDDPARVEAALGQALPGLRGAKLSAVRLKPEAWTARCKLVLAGEDGRDQVRYFAGTIVPPGEPELPGMRALPQGNTLSISGSFTGLSGPATKAHLSLSKGPGIPGAPLVDLTLEGDVAGKVTGQATLDPNQLAALRSGKLYIQIDSEKMPSGHLWGWLLDEHDVAGQGVPQKGPWFVPPFAVMRRHRRNRMNRSALPLIVIAYVITMAAGRAAQNAPRQTTWTFDRLDAIGGLPVKVDGNPKVIETPLGKAIEFDGVDDSIYIDQHPLAGAEQFTFEAIFRPDGGAAEQRWFHLAERSPATGQLVELTGSSTRDANARFLFELRVINGNQWCLDAFVAGPGYSRALLFRDKLHPTGQWYHVASTYDGKMFRSYVNGELQGEAELAFKPHGPGGTSVGTRMNHVNYFNGAVRQARFTPRALTPDQFLKMPGTK